MLIPAALTSTYGRMVGSRRQGWAIFAAMAILWVGGVAVAYHAEQHGTPAQHVAGVTTRHIAGSTGGNLEGKEQRNGIVQSALWADHHHGDLQRLGQRLMESLTGLGSAVPISNLGDERGGVRRCRHGPVLDARLRPSWRCSSAG